MPDTLNGDHTVRITVRLLIAAALAGAAPAVVGTAPGCAAVRAANAEAAYANAQELYIAAVATALDARRAGVIPPADWAARWNPVIQDGNDALDAMAAALARSRADPGVGVARAALEEALRVLSARLATLPEDHR